MLDFSEKRLDLDLPKSTTSDPPTWPTLGEYADEEEVNFGRPLTLWESRLRRRSSAFNSNLTCLRGS